MSTSILATKLYLPPPRPGFVLRPRLTERLNGGLYRKLILISAPAGFGKTTLVSEWIEESGQQAAWLSLDEGDNDPARFLAYLAAALQTIEPGIGEGMLGDLQSSQPPSTEVILTALLNEIITIPRDFILVLDDYHLIDTKPVDIALAFLVEHLPARMHLVITTRQDPQLPLARLRARGQLTEVRAAELRFTASEAADFLNQVMGLRLSAADIAALEERTEGWIAGLQLAALSIQGRPDVPGFIRTFAGDHRYIVDYLVEEVLQRQPAPVRNFLLQTAILDRLNGPLCDAVTGQEGGSARLDALERGNLFIVPLDDKRLWYRYHHLFAEVLAAHLRAEQPEQVSVLHGRASEWYERNGSPADAIHHALAAANFERAADLIERAVPAMRQSRQESTLLGWLKALPAELLQDRPVLNVHYAGTLLQMGQLDGVEDRLRVAERWLDMSANQDEQPVFIDAEDFHRLPALVAMYYAGMALIRGDVTSAMSSARWVLELAPGDDNFLRGAASAILGLASWTGGDLDTAYRMYTDGMAHLQRVGYISDAIGGSIALADIRIAQSRLHEAMGLYERGLQLAAEQGAPLMRGTADMYVGIGEIKREQNDLAVATQHLLTSKAQGDHTGFPQYPYRWRVAMARIQQTQGDLDGALELLHEAERLYVSDFLPNVRPVAALKARVWVAQGRLGEALDWARAQSLSVANELSYLHEFEHITLARVRLAQCKSECADGPISEVIGFLERLLKAAEEGGRTGSAIEILIVQALVHRIRGDTPAALVPLQQALKLAEPEGYIRIFVEEGQPMGQLLFEAAKRGIMPDYTGKLLSALATEQQSGTGESHLPAPGKSSPTSQPLIEPLSQRELDVLRLFKTELSGPEIAQELVIGLSTVRTHTKSIYSKLNVDNRRAAVRRAVDLNLI